jgi:DNA (cytosine-5)-methyltransferase 1
MTNELAPLKHGHWKLTDLDSVPKNGLKVFSCFHCGGGSTMGYKLAGYEVIGGVEIDPEMMNIYRANHNPRLSYLMGVEDFNKIPNDNLLPELFELDILDGSPPCSSFSTSGSREKKWGKASKFREGQSLQVLDDLFFYFIDTAKKLRPKVVVAENVKGLIQGNARGYVKEIFRNFAEAGYDCQLFLLNASRMGVPQLRERVFFIARNKELNWMPIELAFNEELINFEKIKTQDRSKKLAKAHLRLWNARIKSDPDLRYAAKRLDGKESNWNNKLIHSDKVLMTNTSSAGNILYDEPRYINDIEIIKAQTFPTDYDFLKGQPTYICGMSVPPFMMQRIADQITRQWFNK